VENVATNVLVVDFELIFVADRSGTRYRFPLSNIVEMEVIQRAMSINYTIFDTNLNMFYSIAMEFTLISSGVYTVY